MNKFDSYYKDKLKDFEQNPPEDAWSKIQEGIHKKRNRRAIFYWRTAGIAASLLLFTTVGVYTLFNDKFDNNFKLDQIVKVPEIQKISDQGRFQNAETQNGNNKLNQTQQNSNQSITRQNRNDLHSLETNIKTSEKIIESKNIIDKISDFFLGDKTTIASQDEKKIYKYARNSYSEKNSNAQVNYNKKNNTGNDINSNVTIQRSLLSTIIGKSQGLVFGTFGSPQNPEVIYDNFTEEELELTLLDDLLQEEKKEEKEEVKVNRLEVLAFAAPTYFSSFSGNSSLPELNDFNNREEFSYSYGVKAGYAIGKKFKVRAGVAMLNLSQVNREVPIDNMLFSASEVSEIEILGSSPINQISTENIDYVGNLRINNEQIAIQNIQEVQDSRAINRFFADVQQDIEYIEIPIEAEYKFLDKKVFDISATGGMSSYILSENLVFARSELGDFELGKATNLNELSFSTNIGVRLDVKMKDNVEFTVEPQFKYLMNTTNNNSDFQPYTVGINAGMKIAF